MSGHGRIRTTGPANPRPRASRFDGPDVRLQGGPTPAGAGANGAATAGRAGGAASGNARSRMFFTRPARLPPCRMMTMLQFPPQRMARQDAEIAADVGDDGADRPAADLGGDLLWRGQVGETGVRSPAGRRGGWPGCARPARGRARRGGTSRRSATLDDPCFERVGAMQAAGDAARISAMSVVPKPHRTETGSVTTRSRIVAASSLP